MMITTLIYLYSRFNKYMAILMHQYGDVILLDNGDINIFYSSV